MTSLSYRGHRFSAPIIQHAVWLYLRFTLSYRDVEELLAERGLDLSYETIRVGYSNSARSSRDACGSGGRGQATVGTSMRWSCGSPAGACTCGVPLTRRAKFSIC